MLLELLTKQLFLRNFVVGAVSLVSTFMNTIPTGPHLLSTWRRNQIRFFTKTNAGVLGAVNVGYTFNPMKLIREEIESVDFIVEEKNGKKNMFIEGIFLQGDLKNRNGRMYPMETLRREVQRYTENHVQSGRALGELGHPDGPTVNLDRVSHKIVSLKENGNNFIGKVKDPFYSDG